jgi:hypothetical protein
MRIAKSILVCVCLLGLAQPVWSQKPNETAKPTPGILGYLDPKTGAFRPLVQNPVEDEEVEPALAPTTGTLVFNFTITIASKNLAGDTIICSAYASTSEFSSAGVGVSANETASVKATVTGSTAKCSVTIPYSWPLKTASTDTVSLNYIVEAVNTSTTAAGELARSSSQNLPTIKVPKTGATTTETIASTI